MMAHVSMRQHVVLAHTLLVFALVSDYPHCFYDDAYNESLAGASKLNKITACSLAFDCTGRSLQVPWQRGMVRRTS